MYKDGIETRPFFWPLHLQNALSDDFKKEKGSLPISESLGENGIYLPLGNHINKKIQKNIISKLINNIKSF
jgi:perosamine synthetase